MEPYEGNIKEHGRKHTLSNYGEVSNGRRNSDKEKSDKIQTLA
jgi:hypothetical protein